MMIENMAKSIAKKLGDFLEANPEQIEIYAYGLELLILPAINFIIVFILAYIIGVLPNMFMFLAVFAPFRLWGGGVHMTTSLRCLVTSTVIIVGLSSISTLHISSVILSFILFSTLFFGIYVIVKWVPATSEKNPITDYKKQIKQKRYMTILVIIWFIGCVVLLKMNLFNYVLALILGAVSSLLLMTPWGYYFIGAIDKILDYIHKGGVTDV